MAEYEQSLKSPERVPYGRRPKLSALRNERSMSAWVRLCFGGGERRPQLSSTVATSDSAVYSDLFLLRVLTIISNSLLIQSSHPSSFQLWFHSLPPLPTNLPPPPQLPANLFPNLPHAHPERRVLVGVGWRGGGGGDGWGIDACFLIGSFVSSRWKISHYVTLPMIHFLILNKYHSYVVK